LERNRKNLSLVQKKERESKRVYSRIDGKRIYSTIKITIDYAGIFCRKEGWEEENSTRLLVLYQKMLFHENK